MPNEEIIFRPIGTLYTPFKDTHCVPIQPRFATGIPAKLVIKPEFVPGLKDLDGFSLIYLIYHLHKSNNYHLAVIPFFDSEYRGVFATRTPNRPNPIGLSVVRLVSIENDVLNIENVDILDGTPILDIKPFVPQMEFQQDVRIGWFEKFVGMDDIEKTD